MFKEDDELRMFEATRLEAVQMVATQLVDRPTTIRPRISSIAVHQQMTWSKGGQAFIKEGFSLRVEGFQLLIIRQPFYLQIQSVSLYKF